MTTVFATSALFLVKHNFAVNRQYRKLGCNNEVQKWFSMILYTSILYPNDSWQSFSPSTSCGQLSSTEAMRCTLLVPMMLFSTINVEQTSSWMALYGCHKRCEVSVTYIKKLHFGYNECQIKNQFDLFFLSYWWHKIQQINKTINI